MKFIFPIFLVCTFASQSIKAQEVVDIEKILKSGMGNKQKSIEITLEAEKLVHPSGFMYANALMNRALQLDPANKKARFYFLLTDTLLIMRNFHKKIAPFITQLSWSEQKTYSEIVDTMSSKSLLEFIALGREEIYKESELQNLFVKTLEKVNEFHKFIIKNTNIEMELVLNLRTEWKKEIFKNCSVFIEKPGHKYRLEHCVVTKRLPLKINNADMIGMRHVTAGLKTALILASAYDLEGVAQVFEQSRNLNLSPEEMIRRIRRLKNFGKLKNGSLLKTIPKLGTEAYSAMKWAIKHKNVVCKHGRGDSFNRPDHLFRSGLCPHPDWFKDLENLTNNRPIVVRRDNWEDINGRYIRNDIQYEIYPYALLYSPVDDLKVLLPNKFDQCGNVKSFPDNSLKGLFPHNDGNIKFMHIRAFKKLNLVGEKCD